MDQKVKSQIRLAAFNMLARREHSRKEMQDKLQRRFEDRELVRDVLVSLEEEGLQSDERFAESFVNARIQRHQGPIKISYELKQKGIADETVDNALLVHQEIWMDLARELAEKKYGHEPPEDLKEKQRRMRFVMQRGFPPDICYKLYDS